MKNIFLRIVIVLISVIIIILIEKLYVKSFIDGYEGKIETSESILNRVSWMLFALSMTYSINEFISAIQNLKDFKIKHLMIPALFILNAVAIILTTGIFVELIFIWVNAITTLIVLKVKTTKIIDTNKSSSV